MLYLFNLVRNYKCLKGDYKLAYDGITCKAIANELNKLSGARIDKVFQPNKNTVILGFYINGKNYALNCSIDSRIL